MTTRNGNGLAPSLIQNWKSTFSVRPAMCRVGTPRISVLATIIDTLARVCQHAGQTRRHQQRERHSHTQVTHEIAERVVDRTRLRRLRMNAGIGIQHRNRAPVEQDKAFPLPCSAPQRLPHPDLPSRTGLLPPAH
jgi:hypothetical protein